MLPTFLLIGECHGYAALVNGEEGGAAPERGHLHPWVPAETAT
jgi:hypothetical protein